jgi:hypothetical protein
VRQESLLDDLVLGGDTVTASVTDTATGNTTTVTWPATWGLPQTWVNVPYTNNGTFRVNAPPTDDTEYDESDIELVAARGAVPFNKKPYAIAPKDSPWDANKEVAAYKFGAGYLQERYAYLVDGKNPNIKSSYKFPHHRAAPNAAVVFRALANGFARLTQAKLGKDEGGVSNHLARHYRKDFKLKPPERADLMALGELVRERTERGEGLEALDERATNTLLALGGGDRELALAALKEALMPQEREDNETSEIDAAAVTDVAASLREGLNALSALMAQVSQVEAELSDGLATLSNLVSPSYDAGTQTVASPGEAPASGLPRSDQAADAPAAPHATAEAAPPAGWDAAALQALVDKVDRLLALQEQKAAETVTPAADVVVEGTPVATEAEAAPADEADGDGVFLDLDKVFAGKQ